MDSQNSDKKTQESNARQVPMASRSNVSPLPTLEGDRFKYSSRDNTYLSQLYSRPIETTLTGFSQVANLVRHPYEFINNMDELLKQASGKNQKTNENLAQTLNQNRQPSAPGSPIVQEMDTFVASSHDQSTSSRSNIRPFQSNDDKTTPENQIPIPALPPIESSTKRGRLEPLTIEEYESKFRLMATDVELIDRVFFGSIACNQLRAALWPYLFGLIQHRGTFEKIHGPDGREAHVFVEHEGNTARWCELQKLYYLYQSQWKAVMPDQEMRFSTFRERKSLIDRDVIRCDRLHPFYAEQSQNLETLTNLLMTYMMYDFDIGYVQGMSDLAGPIVYMYKGDPVKSFWVFVEVMKLFRRNFELTQKTIHFQLNCLNELIKNTDPIFAQYLAEHESSNCFFAFRAIVCQFKRELMKEDEDDYSKVLFLWDTIWAVKRRCSMLDELKALEQDDSAEANEFKKFDEASQQLEPSKAITEQPGTANDNPFFMPFDPNQSDTLRHTLTETEIFVLALCLSMIRRERDIILANKLDGTDIHLHFIDPKLSSDVNGFIEHAINIYSYMKSDFDITKLTSPKEEVVAQELNPESPFGSAEGYDLLSDFLVINGASGT